MSDSYPNPCIYELNEFLSKYPQESLEQNPERKKNLTDLFHLLLKGMGHHLFYSHDGVEYDTECVFAGVSVEEEKLIFYAAVFPSIPNIEEHVTTLVQAAQYVKFFNPSFPRDVLPMPSGFRISAHKDTSVCLIMPQEWSIKFFDQHLNLPKEESSIEELREMKFQNIKFDRMKRSIHISEQEMAAIRDDSPIWSNLQEEFPEREPQPESQQGLMHLIPHLKEIQRLCDVGLELFAKERKDLEKIEEVFAKTKGMYNKIKGVLSGQVKRKRTESPFLRRQKPALNPENNDGQKE